MADPPHCTVAAAVVVAATLMTLLSSWSPIGVAQAAHLNMQSDSAVITLGAAGDVTIARASAAALTLAAASVTVNAATVKLAGDVHVTGDTIVGGSLMGQATSVVVVGAGYGSNKYGASLDGGDTWTGFPALPSVGDGLAVSCSATRCCIGFSGGSHDTALYFTDDGVAFTKATTFPMPSVFGIAHAGGDKWVVAGSNNLGGDASAAFSSDNGVTWTESANHNVVGQARAVACDGDVCAMYGWIAPHVAYSTDAGASWTVGANDGGIGSNYGDMATDGNGRFVLVHGGSGRASHSSDGGASWTLATTPPQVAPWGVDYAAVTSLFMACGYPVNAGVYAYTSADGGVNWSPVSTMPFQVECRGVAHSAAVGSAAHGRWFAVGKTTVGVAYSDDSGATWTALGPEAPWSGGFSGASIGVLGGVVNIPVTGTVDGVDVGVAVPALQSSVAANGARLDAVDAHSFSACSTEYYAVATETPPSSGVDYAQRGGEVEKIGNDISLVNNAMIVAAGVVARCECRAAYHGGSATLWVTIDGTWSGIRSYSNSVTGITYSAATALVDTRAGVAKSVTCQTSHSSMTELQGEGIACFTVG